MSEPPSLAYLCDRNLGRRFAEILRQAGLEVLAHDDLFPQRTPDVVLLEEAARRGYILLTLDARMRRNPVEKEAIRRAKARVIFLPMPREPGWAEALAQGFLGLQGRIHRLLERYPPPTLLRLTRRPAKGGGLEYRLERLDL